MVKSLKEDSSDSGKSVSTVQTTTRAISAPHWRIEKKNFVHKPATPNVFKVYIRAQFCESPLEFRYCKAKYTQKPDCRDDQMAIYMKELRDTRIFPADHLAKIELAVDAVYSMKGDFNSLRSMFGADCNIGKHHLSIAVRVGTAEFVNVDKLQNAIQILIYPNDWSKFEG